MTVRATIMRLQARAGVRLALVQGAVVVVAFMLAGYLAQLSLERISQTSIRASVRGEAASLNDEYRQKGAHHLPYTVAKRSRLWRGFDYRLTSPQHLPLAGRLPAGDEAAGWREVVVPQSDAAPKRYLAYTEVMPDGGFLTVGQDLAVEAREMQAIDRTLLACGALGVVFCVAASHLFSRGTWRRIAAVSKTAHAVSEGRLDIRAPTPEGLPRDDVDELARTFNVMLDRLNALVSQVRQVSTDIAHDLRTPLTRLSQKLERLRLGAGKNAALLNAVNDLEADIDEILRTFDALLQLSEIEAADRLSGAKTVDLADVASRVCDAYRPDIEESGRTLNVRLASALIDGDPELLAQGVANLLENAMRHTPTGTCILVATGGSAGAPELTVEDDGPGIPADRRQQVVRPFVRLEPSRNTPGSGLGLAIAAAVSARHKAVLALEDAGPGLRVRFRFSPSRTTKSAASDQTSQSPPANADAAINPLG
jgi:signal transduction histidine kinase